MQRYKKIRLYAISGGFFFIFKDFWGVEFGDWGAVPGGGWREAVKELLDGGVAQGLGDTAVYGYK